MASMPITVPPAEEEQVKELGRMLQLGSPALVGPQNATMELPASIYHLLKDVVGHLKAGNAITLVPQKPYLTTQAAAMLLGCSRPHLIKLLETGAIPFHKVGQHRRVRLRDALEFQRRRDTARHAALNALARTEVEQGTYEGVPIPAGGSDE